MIIARSLAEMNIALQSAGKKSLGFVPTMGALHEGHASLLKKAREENEKLVLSIFVNPTQFGPKEDFSQYPRTIEDDLLLAERSGVDIVFMPSVEDIYPSDWSTSIEVSGISEPLCGQFRPGHFKGVATVVYRLLQIVHPTRAYFGQKDLQQFFVIKKMCENLKLGAEIIMVPTLRDKDGLALSSRNRYLSKEDREKALVIPRALRAVKEMTGEKRVSQLLEEANNILRAAPDFKLQYLEIRSLPELKAIKELHGPAAILIAGHLGGTRLIDNMILE